MGTVNTEAQPNKPLDEAKQKWAEIDKNADMLTLEYMKNGDMWGFIKKIAWAGVKVPNKILWKIFFCRGLFSMLSSFWLID